jgi:class 3 adenylate cyclase
MDGQMAAGIERATPAGPASEVRQATILMCDVVNSTQIKTRLGLQEQADFDQGWKDIVHRANRFGATIERFDGDGAFLTFGRQEQREDAAEAALRTAKILVAEVEQSQLVPGVGLQVRVGVASGAIAVINDSPPSVAGTTIDLAERLRAAADPNQILLCDQTHRRASGFFDYDDLGKVPAKGFDGGVRAWRLGPVRPVTSRFEAQRSAGPIVGRAEVLEQLSDLWTKSMGGRPQTVWLMGDAGIGKSRLARAVRGMAEASDAVTLTIDCRPSTVNTPLFPVGALLRRGAGVTPTMSAGEVTDALRSLLETLVPSAEIDESLGYLAGLLGPVTETDAARLPAADIQEKTISVLLGIVSALVADRPGFVLCEDLHWADDSTLQLIGRICASLEGRQILVLATSRGAAPESIAGAPSLTTIPVAPLDQTASLELVHGLAGAAQLSEGAITIIVSRCEGVPLLIEELTRSALEQPATATQSTAGTSEGDVPVPLQLVVETRLAQQGDIARIAKVASVLGREVYVPLLMHLTAADPATLTAALQRLGEEGLFESYESGRRARFRHAMICEAVYATVMPRERRTWHSSVADALLGTFAAASEATPDVLAEHLRKAGRFREAIDVRLQAAAATAARGAFVESEGHCRAALGLIGQLADPDEAPRLEFRLLVQLGVALSGRLGYSAREVEETYLRAYALCDDAEAATLCPIMHGLAAFNLLRGRLHSAYELSRRGLSAAERSGRIDLIIDALSMVSYTSFWYRPYSETLKWVEQCLDLYEKHDGGSLTYLMPYDAATAALGILPTVLWMLGDPAGADAAFQRSVRHIQGGGRDIDVALMQGWFAGFRITQQRWSECAAHSDVGRQIGEEFSTWRELAAITHAMAVAHRTGSPQDARAAIAALDAYEAGGSAVSVAHYCAGIARACVKAGEPGLALATVERGLACSARCEETWMIPELTILKAELEPDGVKALTLLRSALDQAEAFGSVAITLLACASLAARYDLPEAAVARKTLAIFAGGEPPEPDWMRPRLATLRDAVRPLAESTAA